MGSQNLLCENHEKTINSRIPLWIHSGIPLEFLWNSSGSPLASLWEPSRIPLEALWEPTRIPLKALWKPSRIPLEALAHPFSLGGLGSWGGRFGSFPAL